MRRIVLASCAGAALMLGLAACGDEVARPGQTTVPRIGAPNYATLAPTPPTTTSTTLAPGETVPLEELVGGETSTYTIRSNDSLSGIARRHGITVAELCRINRLDDCPQTLLLPGEDLVVPKGSAIDTVPLDDPLLSPPPLEGDECPNGSERPTYEITAEDTSQARAARRIGIDFELLEWINRGNPTWNSFVPGTNLLLPCDGEELPENVNMTIVLDPDNTVT